MSEIVINRRVAAIPPSATLAVTSRAKALAAEGKEVFSFAAGEPDFDTPEHIKTAAAAALASGETKYAPVPGLPELRAAIAAKLGRDNGLSYLPEQVLLSCGAKHSLFNIIMALCDEDNEVVVPAPYWLSYPEMIRMASARPVFVRCREENDFKMTPEEFEAAVTDRTKAVILNSPSNPIGVVYSRDEIEGVVEVAVRRGLYIIADEVYEKLIYDGAEHVSPGSLSREALDLTVTINGFSKTYAMTGWRLGYCAGPLPLVKAASALQSHSTSSPTTFAQHGALAALEGPQDCIDEMARAFKERRTYLHGRLQSLPGVACVKPMGAFYALPSIAGSGLDSVTFAERLLDAENVAVVPGAPFGAEGHIRLSYACGMDNIRAGTDRLERFLASL